jgi:hypothetical protein
VARTYANPATGDRGARQEIPFGQNEPAENSHIPDAKQAIRAKLIGSDQCTAVGMTAIGNVPALVLCRELLAAGINPDTALEIYRAGILSLRVRSIAAGAKLDVNDERFVPYRSRPGPAGRARAAPPMRQTERPATPMAEAAE